MAGPFPKDGSVSNGVFWLNGESWLILDYTKPLNEHLMELLQSQRVYIERLTARADALEQWLNLFKEKSRVFLKEQ